MFSFSSPVREGTEAGCGAGASEAGYDTDEHEFLEEQEADKEVTEAGDFLSEPSAVVPGLVSQGRG